MRISLMALALALAFVLPVSADEPDYEVTVYGGWNNVAGPGVTPETVNIGCITIVYGWDAETQTWEVWAPGFPGNTIDVMEPAKGYWIHCDDPPGYWTFKNRVDGIEASSTGRPPQ